MKTRLETERLVLRPLRSGDVRELRAFVLRNQEHLRGRSTRGDEGKSSASIVGLAKRIEAERRERREGRAYRFAIIAKDDERYVGEVAIEHVLRGALQSASLGYLLDVLQLGRGLAREAVRAVVGFAFDLLALNRIQAAVLPENDRSRRLVEALGFRMEGLARGYLQVSGMFRDHVIFAMTADEWRARGPE